MSGSPTVGGRGDKIPELDFNLGKNGLWAEAVRGTVTRDFLGEQAFAVTPQAGCGVDVWLSSTRTALEMIVGVLGVGVFPGAGTKADAVAR